MGLMAVPPVQSKTSLPQTWHIPQRREGIQAQEVQGLKISKVKPPPSQVEAGSIQPKKRRRIVEGVLPNTYCPIQQPIPSSSFAQSLLQQLSSTGSDAQLLKYLPSCLSGDELRVCHGSLCDSAPPMIDSKYGPVPFGSVLSYQQKPEKISLDIINHPEHQTYPDFSLPTLNLDFNFVLTQPQLDVYTGLGVTRSLSLDEVHVLVRCYMTICDKSCSMFLLHNILILMICQMWKKLVLFLPMITYEMFSLC
jgi:hypothetical protein